MLGQRSSALRKRAAWVRISSRLSPAMLGLVGRRFREHKFVARLLVSVVVSMLLFNFFVCD